MFNNPIIYGNFPPSVLVFLSIIFGAPIVALIVWRIVQYRKTGRFAVPSDEVSVIYSNKGRTKGEWLLHLITMGKYGTPLPKKDTDLPEIYRIDA